MSAGNFLGAIFCSILAAALWLVVGRMIDVVVKVFNKTITVLPSFQDAVNGVQITTVIYSILLVIIWIVIWWNYATNESSEASGLV